MAEATLTLGYDQFAVEMSMFLGFGLTAPTSGDNFTIMDNLIQRGLREFYNAYDWSFLKPQSLALTLASAGTSVALTTTPNFGGLHGDVTVSSIDRSYPVVVVNEQRMRVLRQEATASTGRPQYCALQPASATTSSLGQVWTLQFWPKADASYTVRVCYHPNLDKIVTSTNPYPLGGQQHGETILEFMLAAAEVNRFDEIGAHSQKAQALLQSSILHDRRHFGATTVGPMTNATQEDTSRSRSFTWARG